MSRITPRNLAYLWNVVVTPRLRRAPYVWGGSFSEANVAVGADCSGAVSAALSALVNGPAMRWQREFFTGTFGGVTPGSKGPWAGIVDTTALRCIASPHEADSKSLMIIAIRQLPDPAQAHMICRVPPPEGCIDIRTEGIDIEMGGASNNYHTSRTDPSCASVMDMAEFNQWLCLPEAVEMSAATLAAIAAQFL